MIESAMLIGPQQHRIFRRQRSLARAVWRRPHKPRLQATHHANMKSGSRFGKTSRMPAPQNLRAQRSTRRRSVMAPPSAPAVPRHRWASLVCGLQARSRTGRDCFDTANNIGAIGLIGEDGEVVSWLLQLAAHDALHSWLMWDKVHQVQLDLCVLRTCIFNNQCCFRLHI